MADGPAPGLDEPEAGGGLAARLARLPAAHPSARPDAGPSGVAWSAGVCRTDVCRTDDWRTTDWADRQPGGDQASEDNWWRGESDIWWRAGDGSAAEADHDDVSGLGDSSELADADDVNGAAGPDGTGSPDDASADDPDETDGQGGGAGARPALTARRTPRPAGPHHGRGDEVGGLHADPDRGLYRPWFSPDASGDPWFAAGPEDLAGS